MVRKPPGALHGPVSQDWLWSELLWWETLVFTPNIFSFFSEIFSKMKWSMFAAKGRKATIVVRVGNNRPDLGVNPICNRWVVEKRRRRSFSFVKLSHLRFTGILEEGRPLFLPCNPPMPGECWCLSQLFSRQNITEIFQELLSAFTSRVLQGWVSPSVRLSSTLTRPCL